MAVMAEVSTTTGAALRGPASPAPAPVKEGDAEKLRFIEEMTSNVDAVQERVLAEILARNAEAEYLAGKCGLAGATDRATFRAKVPVVEYKDLLPYHPPHRRRRPLAHPHGAGPPRHRVLHQLRHVRRRAQAHTHRRG